MAVRSFAYEQLTPQARDRADALVKLNPNYEQWKPMLPAGASPAAQNEMLFMIAATWPDQIKGDGKHQADGAAGGKPPPSDGTAAQNIGSGGTGVHKYGDVID